MDVDIISLKKCLQDLEEVLQKLENKPITNNEEKDSVILQRTLDELADYIDSNNKRGPKLEFGYYLGHSIWLLLNELLEDKTYGLKAILLLWNSVNDSNKDYLLKAKFLEEENETDNVNSISDWLLKNCSTEMMFIFLDSVITTSPSKE